MEVEQPITRDDILKLIERKDEIEGQIRELKIILNSNNIGMTEPLVDNEGYPRQDVNVYQVRHARHKIICLQNDHKLLMSHIEKGLHFLHSQSCENRSNINEGTSHSLPEGRPFASIIQVDADSPAYLAGLQVGDEIISFGTINFENFKTMQDIAQVVQHSIGRNVIVIIKRGSHVKRVLLTPKEWNGKGLLGCIIKGLDDIER